MPPHVTQLAPAEHLVDGVREDIRDGDAIRGVGERVADDRPARLPEFAGVGDVTDEGLPPDVVWQQARGGGGWKGAGRTGKGTFARTFLTRHMIWGQIDVTYSECFER